MSIVTNVLKLTTMKAKHTEKQLKKLAKVLFENNIDAYNCTPIYEKQGLTSREIRKVEAYYDLLFT